MLVDSHCHLDFPYLSDQLDDVLARAKNAEIETLVTICTRVRKFPQVLAIVEAHEHIFCSVGTHPHNAEEERDIPLEEIVALSKHPKVVAIGEAGLDYFRDNAPRDDQEKGFRTHIAAARETRLPLVIHTRDADDDTASILEEEMASSQRCCIASRRAPSLRAAGLISVSMYLSQVC
jgi:TatD DNase family protein